MASGDTKTESYLRTAAEGTRADLPSDNCCNTKTQNLIVGVAERIMDVEDEVEEMKNNPDVVDIVATYADLQAYDTSKLTDKDVIRVLTDSTHDDESTYYRYSKQTGQFTYIGTSKQYTNFVGTDGTTAGVNGLVPAPATTDADKFLKSDGTWAIAGGGVKTLTTDDYNYPTANPDGIALWTLDEGQYIIEPQTAYYLERYDRRSGSSSSPAVFILKKPATSGRGVYIISSGGSVGNAYVYYSIDADGGNSSNYLLTTLVENNLTSFSTTSALSARQGKALKDLIDSLVITGAGAPTTSTVGTVGQLYEDTTNGKLYQCTAVSGSTYTWSEVGAGGGGGVTPVQTTGTSTTDVMSQDATTKMIYPDIVNNPHKMVIGEGSILGTNKGVAINGSIASGLNSGSIAIGISDGSYAQIGTKGRASAGVAIGTDAGVGRGNGSVSIGANAYCDSGQDVGDNVAIGHNSYAGNASATSTVALGAYAKTTRTGEVNVGAGTSGTGYNSTNYRVIGGVYDGQDAHDVVTVNQVNSVIDAINTALSTSIPHIGA